MREKRPTLVSLARELGVSRQTISNAINHPEVLAPHTLMRVGKAIEESGYRPDRAARQLRTARSRTIAVRIYDDQTDISGHVLTTFEHELARRADLDGYRLLVFVAKDNGSEVATCKRLIAAQEIDGVILTSTTLEDQRPYLLAEAKIPFTSFGRPWSNRVDVDTVPFPWVDIDAVEGTRLATENLLGRGFTRIGYLSWPLVPGMGEERHAGWSRTMQAAGLSDELIEFTEEIIESATEVASRLLARGAQAIVCASDSLALGAHAAIGDKDIALIGFDDTPTAKALGISSVVQPIHEAAEACFTQLIERIDNPDAAPHRLLAPQLVLR